MFVYIFVSYVILDDYNERVYVCVSSGLNYDIILYIG